MTELKVIPFLGTTCFISKCRISGKTDSGNSEFVRQIILWPIKEERSLIPSLEILSFTLFKKIAEYSPLIQIELH